MSEQQMDRKHNHGEAFCLMKYRCAKCACTEQLWNSRDGVTPFIIECQKCGGEMQHVDWHSDVYAPEMGELFRLGNSPVKRVFVDAKPTHKHIRDAAQKYVDEWWDQNPSNGGGTMKEVMQHVHGEKMEKPEAVEYFINEWTKEGSPTLLTAEEYANE